MHSLVDDYNFLVTRIINHKKDFPAKVGDREWEVQGLELSNERSIYMKQIIAVYNGVKKDYTDIIKISSELSAWIKEQ